MMAHCRAAPGPRLAHPPLPRGHAGLDGRLQRFKDGAFRLAFEAKVPVYPVAISGTAEALPKHGLVMRSRMDARVEVLEPIDPGAFASADALREAARAAIAAALPGGEPAGAAPASPPQGSPAPQG